jgi:hypothetical protein
MEKYEACGRRKSRQLLLGLLDNNNQGKFHNYIKRWRLDE